MTNQRYNSRTAGTLCRLAIIGAGVLTALAGASAAEDKALRTLPIREVTVFKDGSAFVDREGRAAVEADGTVVLDELPIPALGTFWPYSVDADTPLASVVAGHSSIPTAVPATSIAELLRANPTATLDVVTVDNTTFTGVMVRQPATSPSPSATAPPSDNLLLLKLTDGTVLALPQAHIKNVRFHDAFESLLPGTLDRPRLTLNFKRKPAGSSMDVGLMYLQKGLRWIPAYKVTLDGKGSAHVNLEGTLANELADLNDIGANLVIGVPNFAYKDQIDPIALQQTLSRLSPLFNATSTTAYGFSNSIMSQYAARSEASADVNTQPVGVTGTERSEDLYLFHVDHIRLKQNEVMTLPIVDYTLPYKDIYTLDLPFLPPADVRQYIDSNIWQQNAKEGPKVIHKIRLTNSNAAPLTTAPVLFFRGPQVIAQSTMTYASSGANADVDLTQAVDVKATHNEEETSRTPNAAKWNGDDYGLVNMTGHISVTNYKNQDVDVEVNRNVFGTTYLADNGGVITKGDPLEGDVPGIASSYYGWWYHFNSVSRVAWKLHLKPKQCLELSYKWKYYYR